jgi:signal peptidase I
VIGLRTWVFKTCVIIGGSMAPTLIGVHHTLKCGDCGLDIECEAAGLIEGETGFCINCGNADIAVPKEVLAGDRILVDHFVWDWRSPRRWEAVVIERPDGSLAVKRLAGLPGETVLLKSGDVYVNGAIQRKSLSQLRATALLVHTDAHRPAPVASTVDRWRPDSALSNWRRSPAGFRYVPVAANPDSIDWLSYHHLRRRPGSHETEPAVIEDVCVYDQSAPRWAGEVNVAADLMLAVRVKTEGLGTLVVSSTHTEEEIELRLVPADGTVELRINGTVAAKSNAGKRLFKNSCRLEFAVFDRQVVCAVDGRPLLEAVELSETTSPPAGSPIPIAIGVEGLAVEITNLTIWRDVHYTTPSELSRRRGIDRPLTLGPDEYFVLGDNSPISDDSRSWIVEPLVKHNSLFGKPLLIYWPSRWTGVGGWGTQVPDLNRIRYIR